jgi:hypothetical protein
MRRNIIFMRRNIIILAAFLSANNGRAQSLQDSSKKKYDFFNPVPRNTMRSFETDRPDVTESAYTVDAGHFQLETDLFKTERYNADGVKTINNYINTANLKLGITHSTDFQVVIATLNTSKIINGGAIIKKSDFGGLTFRIKQNLWGNNNGNTALAILPFVSAPENSDSKLSGGIILPFAMSLAPGWDFGAQVETDLAANQNGNNYHFNFLASATTSYPLCKNLDFFTEVVITLDNETKMYEYFINGGPIYAIARNINLDCGIYYGIKNISSKTYFAGLSFRI